MVANGTPGAKCDVSGCLVAAAYTKYRTDGRVYKVRSNFQTRAVLLRLFFTARRSYASAVLGVLILCVRLSVCLSVCLSVTRVLCD